MHPSIRLPDFSHGVEITTKYKSDHGFKSKDEVIQHLLGLSADNVDAVPAGSDEDDGMDGVDDDVPKGKLAQGIFYASLGNDAKSVKHFTGLNDSVYQWVRQQLTQAVRKTLFFFVVFPRKGHELHCECFGVASMIEAHMANLI